MSSKCNKNFGRRLPPEALARTVVDEIDNGIELCLRDRAEIEAFGEEETQNIVGVFVRAALPRFMRLANGDNGKHCRFCASADIGRSCASPRG